MTHRAASSEPQPPLVEELSPAPGVEEALLRLADRRHVLLLDSALAAEASPEEDRSKAASSGDDDELGRYSFLMADPLDFWSEPADGRDGLAALAARIAPYQAARIPDLPPFQGGAAGLFSYDLGRSLERVRAATHDEFGLPALAIGLYDTVVAFDHRQGRAWLISHGFRAPSADGRRDDGADGAVDGASARRDRAAARLARFRQWLARPAPPLRRGADGGGPPPLSADRLAPRHEVDGRRGLLSSFDRKGYLAMVRRAIEYIHAGDVFQVNLAQRLLHPARCDAVDLYLRLRRRNPAPFAGYFDLGSAQLCSASPERFLRVRDHQVEARPIKGTRARRDRAEADLYAAADLQASEKDRAENVMIVDLMRNDLSRTCRPESVQVAQLCGLERYATVQHLVSVIRGTLRDDAAPLDLLRTSFPGGSITGAPKVRAMEIIAELEATARGAYCGSLGYLGFDGALDTSILIRTITASRGWWQLPAGGGIVAQSDPADEYEETWHKAEGMLRAIDK